MTSRGDGLLIVGTGALACLFAARLARAGIPVKMLGEWPEGVKAIRQAGIHLTEPDGSENTYPVQVLDAFDDCRDISHALVLVKSWQTERKAQKLSGCMAADGCVLTLQNGWGNQEVLERWLAVGSVFTGVTTTGASLLSPGYVRAGGEGTVSLPQDTRLHAFKGWLQQAGFPVETTPNLDSIIWGKLLINAAINPLTALLGIPNGELLTLHSTRILMKKVSLEVAKVAHAKGVLLPFADPIAAVEEVARKTAFNRSSMLQDIQRGAPTEIDVICGYIARTGKTLGVAVPMNETLYQLINAFVEVNKNDGNRN